MKIQKTSSSKRGFTLMELMVAMAITTIIVTVLVSITSIALDTWNRSRSELRASRQAKGMLDVMARDFEALVTRRGNTSEWLSAVTDPKLSDIGDNIKSTNASKLIFFTAATDRYDGQINVPNKDNGGDVSCVAYQLEYKDPIGSDKPEFKTFVLSRKLVNPDLTFNTLLGKPDLASAFEAYSTMLKDPENFIGENIYQFTLTFHVQVTDAAATPPISNIPVALGKSATKFRILGSGIVSDYSGSSAALLPTGRITAIEISASVISDFGVDQLKRRKFTGTQQAEFLAKNSYQYTKLVQLPSM
jgi:prepilin-type N-terminal cleavage/methylation domain-containing protein